MKRFFKWTVGIAAAVAGGALVYRAVDAGRTRLKRAIGNAEEVAGRTRNALEQTEAALHQARTSL